MWSSLRKLRLGTRFVLSMALPAGLAAAFGAWVGHPVAAALTAVGITLGVVFWWAWQFQTLLKQLTEATLQIASGRLETPLPDTPPGQFAELTTALSHLSEALQESGERANTDGLTTLHNHRHFQQRLVQEIARAKRFGSRLALLMMDLDYFKAINDTYGHQTGDEVLRTMSLITQQSVREIDVVARYGGDELVIMLVEADAVQGEGIAESIRRQITAARFRVSTTNGNDGQPPTGEQEIHITVSIGVAEFPTDASNAEGLVAAADAALARAKQTGRDRVCTRTSSGMLEGAEDCIKVHRMLQAGTFGQDKEQGSENEPPFDCAHCRSLTRYAVALGIGLGMEREELENIRRMGILHDLGQSEGKPLSQGMAAQVLPHGLRTTSTTPGLVHHHEWWNGRGYPDGLQGEAIPLAARILAIAESYQTLTSSRQFREAYSHGYAMIELRRNAGAQFDPHLVEVFAQTLGDDPDTRLAEIGCQAVGQQTTLRR